MPFRRLLVIAFVLGSCLHGSSAARAEVRAVWVSRWEFKSEADIREMMAWLAEQGFNVVLFQVRGQGTVYYRSAIEPPAETLAGTSGWDPLAVALQEAQARGLQLHAWINVFPGWRGETPHPDPRQLWNFHRDWFLMSVDGSRDFRAAEYAFLTPTLPSVRSYLVSLLRELWTSYPVDGIHFDYIRYPGPGYGYDPESLLLFRGTTGLEPEEDLLAWDDFRREAITQFLREIRQALDAEGKQLRLSAAVIGDWRMGRSVFLQDSHQWMSESLLDAIFPMTYTPDTTRFAREIREHQLDAHATRVYPGILVERNPNWPQEIAIARRLGTGGFCLFSYGGLRKAAEKDSLFLLTLRRLLRTPQPSPTPWPTQPRGTSDRWGPVIAHVRRSPPQVPSDRRWEVECSIRDPSGVLLRSVPPRSPYLIWTVGSPLEGGKVELMLPTPVGSDTYRTLHSLEPVPAGSAVYYRIFAADRTHSDPTLCNWNYSLLERAWAVPSNSSWRATGKLGPALWGARSCAVDGRGNVWVVESIRNQLRVFTPEGRELLFSPLNVSRLLGAPAEPNAALAAVIAHDDTVYVAVRANGGRLVAVSAYSGGVLFRVQLDRPPGDVELLDRGNFVAASPDGSCWWIFDRTGLLRKPPVCTSHLTQGIAVLPGGEAILATCRSEDVLHVWRRLDPNSPLYEEIPTDLPFQDIRMGDVETGPDGHIFLCLAGAGLVLELNSDFQVIDALSQNLRAPLTLGLSPDGRRAYVVEAPGLGPEFIRIFERQ